MSINNEKYVFAVIGGDSRQTVIVNELIRLGNLAAACDGADMMTNLEKSINGSDVVLLPLPVTRDKVNLLFASDAKATDAVTLADLVSVASRCGCRAIMGGMIPEEICELGKKHGLFVAD